MLYTARPLTKADETVLETLGELRGELGAYLTTPRRWHGTLRRATFALAVQGSNSIEGYNASVEDVAAVIADEAPLDADAETVHAIEGYRDAMTYVIALARDAAPVDASVLKALHFMMLKYDLSKNPGQWRPGGIWISNPEGATVYTAPDRELVDDLVLELTQYLSEGDGNHVVRAAMAHLNLTLIHPFSDGNGRMARCLQSLVLASAGLASPEFASIEEYLGQNTAAYYDVLADVGGGSWQPRRDTSPWIRFCLTAHVRQARALLRRIRETEGLWDRCEQLASTHGLPPRVVGALCDASRGWRTRRSLYVKVVEQSAGEAITDATATRDLAALTKAGLLRPFGEKRARQYLPTDVLRAEWEQIRARRTPRDDDPYAGTTASSKRTTAETNDLVKRAAERAEPILERRGEILVSGMPHHVIAPLRRELRATARRRGWKFQSIALDDAVIVVLDGPEFAKLREHEPPFWWDAIRNIDYTKPAEPVPPELQSQFEWSDLL